MVDYRHLPEESLPPSSDSRINPHHSPLHSHISSTKNPYEKEKSKSTAAVSDDSASSDISSLQNVSQRRWALALYSITTILLYADQNLMSPNLSAMAEEFNFSDLERDKKLGGDIALAFWMLGVPASIVVGCLADHMNRSVLFAWTVGLGEGACLLTYFTTTYAQLYVCRAITGLSMGGALPVIYSVLGDFFRADERHGVNAMVAMGTGLGIALGQGVAGFLGPTFGWRLPFLVVSVPALVMAAAVLLTVEDPERGGMERAVLQQRRQLSGGQQQKEWTSVPQEERLELELTSLHQSHVGREQTEPTSAQNSNDGLQQQDESSDDSETKLHPHHVETTSETRNWRSLFQTFCSLLSIRSVLLALVQGAPGCVPWGIVNTYLNDYLSDDRGMTVEFATFVLLLFGFGNFVGMMVGGAGGNYLYKRDPRYPSLLAGSSAILGCIPFYWLINFIDSSSSILSIAMTTLLAGIGSGVTGPIVKATLQNVTLPTTRGQAFALANTFDDFGRGLGPVFVAMLIASTGGRTAAFNIGLLGWVFCGILNLTIFLTVRKDEQEVQSILAGYV